MTTIAITPQASIVSLFKGWTKYELLWLFISTAVITATAFATDSSPLSFVSSIAGILCVVLAAKGKIATYYVGIIQASTYAYISYEYQLYGEAMLNAFFYLPVQFIGIFLWMRHAKNKQEAVNGEDIFVKRLTKKQWLVLIPVVLIAIIAYAFALASINATAPRIDSAAVVLSIVAQILMLARFVEQWLLWIAVNVLTITLWVVTLIASGGNDWTFVAMWTAFLVNSVYGYVNWRKLAAAGVKKTSNADIEKV